MAEADQSRDLILAPNETVCVLDKTNGMVSVYAGPKQDALGGGVVPVLFNEKTKAFDRLEGDLKRAIRTFTVAPEGFYVVLKNPAKDGAHPPTANKSPMPVLDTGRKVNIPGPVAFALWPAQMAKVLPGHTLRSNQYLVIRVYDEEQAKKNWKNTVLRKAKEANQKPGENQETAGKPEETAAVTGGEMPDLTMGRLLIVKGEDVAFYIPPTGIEVVADQNGHLVRDAVTLERLEYCQLLDQDGNKRYVQGPAVVFPLPTEIFKTRTENKEGETPRETRKFKALELSETSGIHVKIIADYTDKASNTEYKAGEERFITGKEQTIYFPQEEHAVIRYDGREIHFATAIPAGEGRYVMSRLTGEAKLVKGPTMLLPDPRTEVILNRILDLKMCEYMYPGNIEALAWNAKLAGIDLAAWLAARAEHQEQKTGGAMLRASARGMAGAPAAAAYMASLGDQAVAAEGMAFNAVMGSVSNTAEGRGLHERSGRGFQGDGFSRNSTYTEPRSITLNTKYSGAVSTDIWSNFAIKLVSKSGDTRVEVGPKNVLLEYDELPQVLKLSTGKPKTTDSLLRTVFLQTKANIISDIVKVQTQDFCDVELTLSYRVNFEGEPNKWFDIENYVKFLCDHMRSRLTSLVRKKNVEEFYSHAVGILRDEILGAKTEGKHRNGTLFPENGMRIYDVEILGVKLGNPEMEKLLTGAKREVITQNLQLAAAKRNLAYTTESEEIARRKLEVQTETFLKDLEIREERLTSQTTFNLREVAAQAQVADEQAKVELAAEKADTATAQEKLARERATSEQDIEFEKARADIAASELREQTAALASRLKAVEPGLIEALQGFSDKALVEKIVAASAPTALIGGNSVVEVLRDVFAASPLAKYLPAAASKAAENGRAAGASTTS